eukprot:Gregarina_sp_Pseudo_9__3453@NODE_3620_length_599_cov_17_103571_g3312_i0_p1_GENE_NODE_3620_length_599_cov_17_103571_g3312_i0NODE_3620_length_599_cov_17_103571_g3312_i0_p1_ORF_typecomplete_len102_score7_31SF3b10/PF07189_11/3_3e32_NODE_3620_length_599_cov_17_103571_g3312_i035340
MSASVYDRFNIHAQLEHLQSKYTGTGHADTTKWQWGATIRRDTLASHVGHHSRLMYFAVARGETIARVRYEFLSVCQTSSTAIQLSSHSGTRTALWSSTSY